MLPYHFSMTQPLRSIFLLGCILSVSACNVVKIGKDEQPIGQTVVERRMPSKKEGILNKKGAKEVWLWVGPIAGMNNTPANGVIQTHVFADGSTVHTVQINILPPPKGKYFAGWLKKEGEVQMIRTGELDSVFDDARHALTFESADDLRSYTTVVVTLQEDNGNSRPGTVVAEGVLKEMPRR